MAVTRCAICFEALSQGIALPCSCKVDYCMQCWDKALAKSFNACAKPRCPSCRTPVRVDFDEQLGTLVFAAEEEDEDPDQIRRRIAGQMRHLQVRLLRDFGELHPLQEDHAGSLADAAGFAAVLFQGGKAPKCVCGGDLERVSLGQRACRFFVQAGQWVDSERLAPVLAQCLMRIVCDLCCEPLDLEQPDVWVCERGDCTIKHATSNDVCTKCLVQHVWGVREVCAPEEGRAEQAEAPPDHPAPP